MLRFRLLALGLLQSALCVSGCVPLGALLWPNQPGAIGLPASGVQRLSAELKTEGTHCVFYRARVRPFGSASLVQLVERAATAVDGAFLGSPLAVGDLSDLDGGFLPGHRSHRTGLDVDLAFYTTDARGRPVPSAPLPRFDSLGLAIRGPHVVRFDDARNWRLVEALVSDPEVKVRHIFVSDGIKARLLSYALVHERELSLVSLAADALHQPKDAPPHDDHFHVRIDCPSGADGALCTGPAEAVSGPSREVLLRLALEGFE